MRPVSDLCVTLSNRWSKGIHCNVGTVLYFCFKVRWILGRLPSLIIVVGSRERVWRAVQWAQAALASCLGGTEKALPPEKTLRDLPLNSLKENYIMLTAASVSPSRFSRSGCVCEWCVTLLNQWSKGIHCNVILSYLILIVKLRWILGYVTWIKWLYTLSCLILSYPNSVSKVNPRLPYLNWRILYYQLNAGTCIPG